MSIEIPTISHETAVLLGEMIGYVLIGLAIYVTYIDYKLRKEKEDEKGDE